MTMFRSGLRRAIYQWRLVTGNNEPVGLKEYFHFKVSNVIVKKSQICIESYYFHVYVVSCDVQFRYSDYAFMWTA